MHKLAIVLGIPLIVVAGILVNEYPEYWWVALAGPLALIRVLMRRTLTEKSDHRPLKTVIDVTDQGHTVKLEKTDDRQ
jgi:hypothetical protein